MSFRKSLIVFLLLFSNLLAKDDIANSIEWKTLLHINDNEQSEIVDKKFILSSPFSPKNEMREMLQALVTDKKCEMLCRFPARYKFLNREMNLGLNFEHCKELETFLKDSKGESASLVFASSYLASPMSYFGHTFIKVNKQNNIFFSQTLSYAAEVPQKIGFFDLVIKGSNGGFNGRYSIVPYFKIADGYKAIEQRSLTEYKLDLTSDEIETMLMHAYELADITIPYRFFTENCTYEILWLLDNARPSMQLHDKTGYFVVPYKVIASAKESKIIVGSETSPSNIEMLFSVYSKMTNKEKQFFALLRNNDNKSKTLEESSLSNNEKSKISYLMNGYYDILFKKFRISKADFADVKALPFEPVKDRLADDNKTILGSSKIKIGQYFAKGISGKELTISPILFNRTDDNSGSLNEGTLEALAAKIIRENEKNKIQTIDFIKLESYVRRFDFYSPMSWRFRIGMDSNTKDEKLRPLAEVGSGVMYGGDMLKWFVIPQIEATSENIGISTRGGFSAWQNNLHYGVDFKRNILFAKNTKPVDESKIYLVLPVTKQTGIEFWDDTSVDKYGLRVNFRF